MKFSRSGLVAISSMMILTLAIGCNSASNDTPEQSKSAEPGRKISIRLLVIDDELLGPVIQRQFSSRQNGEVELSAISWQELVDADFDPVRQNDILIYPSRRIGELASRGLLVPITDDNSRIDKDSRRSLLFSDRDLAVSWGNEEVAMSLGQSHWVMLFRSDVLEAVDLEPPRTWKEFEVLALALSGLPTDGGLPNRIGVPLQGRWAGYALMLRTASAIRMQGKYSSYFDVGSMEPFVDSEPFLRSLQGWQRELAGLSTATTPAEIFSEYANGNLAVAVVPMNPYWMKPEGIESLPPTTLAGIPGWESTYDQSREMWIQQRESALLTVPLVGGTGMLASSSIGTSQQRNAIEVIAWMTSKQISSVISVESPNTGISRKSHTGNPGKWLGPLVSGENASRFSDYLNELNGGRRNLNVLRLPNADRYLDALDNAVRSVVIDGKNAVEELASVDLMWRSISDELGLEQQKTGYRLSEGLSK